MRFALVLAALSLAALPVCGAAQTVAPSAPETTLAVAGVGLIERSPDVARVAVTIVTDDAVAARSTGKNTELYDGLRSKLAALGITADRVQTTFFNVDFVPGPAKGLTPEQRAPRYGYVTSRTLSIAVTPLENAGRVVDAATAAGVTDIGNVAFDLQDRKGAYHEALGAALNDAKANAEALAAAGGFRIVRIRTVSSEGATPIRPIAAPMFRAALANESSQPPTDIQPNGPISVAAHVNVTYEIR